MNSNGLNGSIKKTIERAIDKEIKLPDYDAF